MTEILFYHLQRQPLETVLPLLLSKSLERGWRCIVEAVGDERVRALDDHLWTFSDNSFLPHGTDDEADIGCLPVVLTCKPSTVLEGVQVRFLLDGAPLPDDPSPYVRIVVLFDGNEPDALTLARNQWRVAKAFAPDHTATYWQQNERGAWEKKA